jgi:hypothetical protein
MRLMDDPKALSIWNLSITMDNLHEIHG